MRIIIKGSAVLYYHQNLAILISQIAAILVSQVIVFHYYQYLAIPASQIAPNPDLPIAVNLASLLPANRALLSAIDPLSLVVISLARYYSHTPYIYITSPLNLCLLKLS